MPRAIDHLVLAAHDLAAQADIYRRMGFSVGARNCHPWGTENHIIQFAESFLELISLGADFDERRSDNFFARSIGESLKRREGFAMLSLRSQDARADAAAFAAAGIGEGEPFHFGRKARRPNGQEVEVAFTLAFAQSPTIGSAGFFTCQQHFPQNFWNPAFQNHANGAVGVSGLLMQAEDPAAIVPFLARFAEATDIREDSSGAHLTLGAGQNIDIFTLAAARERFGESLPQDLPNGPCFLGVTITVQDLDQLRSALDAGKTPYESFGEAIVVPARAACGTILMFEPTRDRKL